ncbi:unnamed protein product [Alopecurus aequalis]
MNMHEEDSSRRDDFPTDTLVEILRRLPPNYRRRSRLVCRQWRDTVDERTATDLLNRAKTLLVDEETAFVLDNKWILKPVMDSPEGQAMEVVGTCNGLICLYDDNRPGGAISLANPANGEKLLLPPLPCADNFMRGRSRWHKAYGFAHHQGTGRYKVVRIPCCFDRQFGKVQVFTLGETSWRDVAAPAVGGSGTRCLRDAGILSVDGAVYWVADGTERIMSFDLEGECVSFVKPLPVPLWTRPRSSFRLAEVYGRLGITIADDSMEKTDVWVLESARGKQRWRRWFSVEMSVQPPQLLMLPHFTHGKHVLMRGDGIDFVYVHKPKPNGTEKRLRYGKVQISEGNRGLSAIEGDVYRAFDYVDNKEPLNVYRLW